MDFRTKSQNAIDKKSSGVDMFVDLAKAFDTVDREILINNLAHYGIHMHIWYGIRIWYAA